MDQPHAIIIGFGLGVGYGIAEAFGRAGFALSLVSRNPDRLRDQHKALTDAGTAAALLAADAGDAAALTRAIEQAISLRGAPVVLVYNAVAPARGKPSTIEPAALTKDFAVNVAGALAATRAVLPAMRAAGSGTVLFTGGGWALYPAAEFASISIGKAALRALTFMLADELAGSGVRAGTVTIMGTVAPGTPFDPVKIGDAFVDLYRQPTATFPVEVQFKGA